MLNGSTMRILTFWYVLKLACRVVQSAVISEVCARHTHAAVLCRDLKWIKTHQLSHIGARRSSVSLLQLHQRRFLPSTCRSLSRLKSTPSFPCDRCHKSRAQSGLAYHSHALRLRELKELSRIFSINVPQTCLHQDFFLG